MDAQKRKKESRRIMKRIINSVYKEADHIPKSKKTVAESIYDFALIRKIVRRILLRRDTAP